MSMKKQTKNTAASVKTRVEKIIPEAKKAVEEKVIPETKKAAEKVVEKVMPEVKEAAEKVVPEAVKAAEKVVPEVKEVAEKVVPEAKKAVEKATEKVKKASAKKEIKTTLFVEYYGKQVQEKDMIASVKKAWTKSGKKVADIKTMALYVKPEENSVYYVINGDSAGRVEF